MCNCKSYNRPDWGGSDEEVVLDPRPLLPLTTKTVCVDACIAVDILNLWHAGIYTKGCCCGHNGKSIKSVGIEHPKDVMLAVSILGEGYQVFTYS